MAAQFSVAAFCVLPWQEMFHKEIPIKQGNFSGESSVSEALSETFSKEISDSKELVMRECQLARRSQC